MKLINGFDDFKKLVEENEQMIPKIWIDKYYSKYKDIFDAMLKYLYHLNINDLMKIVENIDFKHLYYKAQLSIENNLTEKVILLIKKCNKILKINEKFNVYFLVGLGHVDGTSLLIKDYKPFIYFGLERLHHTNLNYLVPHEFNHLARLSKFKFLKEKLKFKDYLIYEGLATYFSIYFNKLEINRKIEAEALFLPEETIDYLYKNKEDILKEIKEVLEFEMNNKLMIEFFTYDKEKNFKKGYFAGLKIIEKLINNGEDIKILTFKETDEILKKYYN
jgi:uncharacterized protein YjaZ